MRLSVQSCQVKLFLHLDLHELEWVFLDLDLQIRLLLLLFVSDAHAFHQVVDGRLKIRHAAIPKKLTDP